MCEVNPWSVICHWSGEIKCLWSQRTQARLNGHHSNVKFIRASIISSRSTLQLQRATVISADEALQCPGTYNKCCPQPAEERGTGRLNDLLQSARGAIVRVGLNTVFPESSFCVSITTALSWLCRVTVWHGWDWKWCLWDVDSGIIHSWWHPAPLVLSKPSAAECTSFKPKLIYFCSIRNIFPKDFCFIFPLRVFICSVLNHSSFPCCLCSRKEAVSPAKLQVCQKIRPQTEGETEKENCCFWVLLVVESSFNVWQFHLHSRTKFLAIHFFFQIEDHHLKGEKISWWFVLLVWKVNQI